MGLTRFLVRKIATTYTRNRGSRYSGEPYHVATFLNTFGTGSTKEEALLDLCEKLHIKQ